MQILHICLSRIVIKVLEEIEVIVYGWSAMVVRELDLMPNTEEHQGKGK